MTFEKIGAVLLFMVILFIFGNIWFNIVESILNKIKRMFIKNEKTINWHNFPDDEKNKKI